MTDDILATGIKAQLKARAMTNDELAKALDDLGFEKETSILAAALLFQAANRIRLLSAQVRTPAELGSRDE